ncbi:hypothetical protein OUZ56_026526 [Daphnia magna]|uniref:HAT C-terminal dimerisation domain-containing protein n=1 Tax=Daphnia magna TaxID=35525 RepID=A0ABQ9ZM12_9CRUS|nr:hypothetical protein OUZ56_026526 [Daphnia magna]
MIERALKLKQKSSESSADKLSLSSQEWDFLAVVFELLKGFRMISEAMGNAKVPTISQVLPSESLHFMAKILDPRFKLKYFQQAGWRLRKINEMREKANSFWVSGQRISYPVLPKMAMDILAIPATSVPVEREFSGLSDIITPNRAKINPLTIETLYDLKGYLKFGGDAATNFIQLI